MNRNTNEFDKFENYTGIFEIITHQPGQEPMVSV
jgi:hypothetical protein